MRLSRPRWMFCEDLLATERTISIAPPIAISPNIPIRMAHIISIFLVERVVCDLVKSLSPEDEAFFEIEPDALQEKCVLQTPVVF